MIIVINLWSSGVVHQTDEGWMSYHSMTRRSSSVLPKQPTPPVVVHRAPHVSTQQWVHESVLAERPSIFYPTLTSAFCMLRALLRKTTIFSSACHHTFSFFIFPYFPSHLFLFQSQLLVSLSIDHLLLPLFPQSHSKVPPLGQFLVQSLAVVFLHISSSHLHSCSPCCF